MVWNSVLPEECEPPAESSILSAGGTLRLQKERVFLLKRIKCTLANGVRPHSQVQKPVGRFPANCTTFSEFSELFLNFFSLGTLFFYYMVIFLSNLKKYIEYLTNAIPKNISLGGITTGKGVREPPCADGAEFCTPGRMCTAN